MSPYGTINFYGNTKLRKVTSAGTGWYSPFVTEPTHPISTCIFLSFASSRTVKIIRTASII